MDLDVEIDKIRNDMIARARSSRSKKIASA